MRCVCVCVCVCVCFNRPYRANRQGTYRQANVCVCVCLSVCVCVCVCIAPAPLPWPRQVRAARMTRHSHYALQDRKQLFTTHTDLFTGPVYTHMHTHGHTHTHSLSLSSLTFWMFNAKYRGGFLNGPGRTHTHTRARSLEKPRLYTGRSVVLPM